MPTTPTLTPFLDKPTDPDTDYVVFAAPLDKTTSNRRGTRFGPDAVRRESTYLDTYSARAGLDWDDLNLSDIGDVDCSDVETCLNAIEETIKTINGFPVMLGGEHTITLGALRALKPDLVVVFDAHLDLRDTLFDERLCHATYLRRGIEELGFKAVVIGARALSKEEVAYAEETENVYFVTAQGFMSDPDGSIEQVKTLVDFAERIYVSIDLDVLDPSYAPAVGNPHPEGLSTTELMDIVEALISPKVIGFDLNEVYPHYDTGATATTAAYIVMETLYAHIRAGEQPE